MIEKFKKVKRRLAPKQTETKAPKVVFPEKLPHAKLVVSDKSPVLMTELVLPSHTNALGTIFGGTVMGWIDIAGAIAAQRYARAPVVTVSIDYLHFIVPIKTGYTVQIHARVTYAGKTSMEVEVLVDAENTVTGEIRRATSAFLTYVAVDDFGRPKRVPKFQAENVEEKKRYREALKRRVMRLKWV